MSPHGLIAEWRVGCKCSGGAGRGTSLSGCSVQLPVLVAAKRRPIWIWFRIQAGKQHGQLHKAEGERGVEMTAELRWCCQEAGVLSIHQLPPQAEASSVKAAGYVSIHGFQ